MMLIKFIVYQNLKLQITVDICTQHPNLYKIKNKKLLLNAHEVPDNVVQSSTGDLIHNNKKSLNEEKARKLICNSISIEIFIALLGYTEVLRLKQYQHDPVGAPQLKYVLELYIKYRMLTN